MGECGDIGTEGVEQFRLVVVFEELEQTHPEEHVLRLAPLVFQQLPAKTHLTSNHTLHLLQNQSGKGLIKMGPRLPHSHI